MVATYTKPTKIPRWADTSTNILEPPELKKDEGWLFEEVPPSAFENWRTNLIGSWAKWLDERLFDGASADEFLIKSPGAGTEAVRITDAYVKVSRDLRVEGDDLGIEVDGTTSRRVYFDAAKQNWLGYSIGGSRMELYAGGVLAIYADATGTYINGDLNIGDDLSLPGGLAVGIPTPTIADDVIQLGDTDNRWDFNSGSPRFIFDHAAGSVDALTFDRVNSRFAWLIAATEEMRLSSLGLAIANGLYVGDVTGTPTDNVIVAEGSGGFGGSLRVGFAGASILSGVLEIGDTQFYLRQQSGNPSITFDSNDGFNYDRAANKLSLNVNVASRVWMGESGVCILQGLYVGGAGWPVTDDTITCEGNGVFWGGMRIGFSGTPTADRIELGDANLFIQWAPDVCEIDFASGVSFSYSRTNSRYAWLIATLEKLRLAATGLSVVDGLQVGFMGTPVADRIELGDTAMYLQWASDYPLLQFDSGDYLRYDRTNNVFGFFLGTSEEFQVGPSGAVVADGLIVGFSGTPSADRIMIGDANMYLQWASDYPSLRFDSGDFERYDRTNNTFEWQIGSTRAALLQRFAATGTYPNGPVTSLYLGDNQSMIEATVGHSRYVPFLDMVCDTVDTANHSFQVMLRARDASYVGTGIGGEMWIGVPNNDPNYHAYGLMFGDSAISQGAYSSWFGIGVGDGVHSTSGAYRGFSIGGWEGSGFRAYTTFVVYPGGVGGWMPYPAGSLQAGDFGQDLGKSSYPWHRVYTCSEHFVCSTGYSFAITQEGANDRLKFTDGSNNSYMRFVRNDYTPNHAVEIVSLFPYYHQAGTQGIIGDATSYWLQVYCNNLRYKSAAAFDTYDDLGLIEQCEPDMEKESVEKSKGGKLRAIQPVKASTIPWPMLADFDKSKGDYFIDAGDASMFLLGAIKQLYKRYKSEISELKARIAALESPA